MQSLHFIANHVFMKWNTQALLVNKAKPLTNVLGKEKEKVLLFVLFVAQVKFLVSLWVLIYLVFLRSTGCLRRSDHQFRLNSRPSQRLNQRSGFCAQPQAPSITAQDNQFTNQAQQSTKPKAQLKDWSTELNWTHSSAQKHSHSFHNQLLWVFLKFVTQKNVSNKT